MSENVSPRSRPPSSASSVSSTSTSNHPRVHVGSLNIGHDHTRPLPPPRLHENAIPIVSTSSTSNLSHAPLTVPLAPLSTSASFRSNNTRTPIIVNQSGTNATIHHVQQNNLDNSVNIVPGVPNASSVNATTPTTLTRGSTGNNDTARSPLGEVTLTVPRPDVERAVNEYVETPFRQTNSTATNLTTNVVSSNQKCLKNERRLHLHHHHQHHHQHQEQQQHQHNQSQQHLNHNQQHDKRIATQSKNTGETVAVTRAQARNPHDNNGSGIRLHQSNLLQSSLSATSPLATVTKQPVSFTKEPSNALGSGSLVAIAGRLNDPNLSIMCDFCGRCRCESCREPPPLPSRWLCDNSCFCSAETALDYASCLCCVKGLFYHCADSGSGTDSEAGGNCADEPCSCTGPRRTARWACLGALTFVLPCLLCYWPLKGCVAMCETCYARHASQGCRCDPNNHGRENHNDNGNDNVVSRDSRDPEKRLLDPVTPEL